MEIFSTYGTVKSVDMPKIRPNSYLTRGFAYVEFEKSDDAEKALKHMDGGQIDGQEVTAAPVLIPKQRPPPLRQPSPPRRGPPPSWRRSPPPRVRARRRSPPRRRSPIRRRSRTRSRTRSPVRRRRVERSSSSSSR